MNVAIHGIDRRIAHGNSFHNDRHPDLKADFILANPPFNVSDWRGEVLKDNRRWECAVLPPRTQPRGVTPLSLPRGQWRRRSRARAKGGKEHGETAAPSGRERGAG
jgi:hypothetical protein